MRSLRGALASGLAFAAAFALAVFPWFAEGIAGYTGAPRGLAFLALLLGAPLLEPQLVAFALARTLARRLGAARPAAACAAALVWVGTEWAFPKLLGDTLGHGLHPAARLRQGADLAGAHGLTLALLLANECALAAGLAAGRGRAGLARAALPAAGVGAIALALLAYGGARLASLRREPAAERVRAALVQADISRYGRLRAELGSYDAVRAILDAHFALSLEALERTPVDLLVWPETVYPTTFGSPRSETGAELDREIGALVAATGVPLVFGAYDREDGAEYNAAVFLEPSPDGRLPFETYRKASLFPLTERVPALLAGERARRWLPWLGSWRPGAGPEVRELRLASGRFLRVAPMICYDAVDPAHAREQVRRGAELLLTLSNDAWFASGGGPRLHLAVSAFRSIETRRPQLRATNTGISAAIDASGAVLAAAGVHERTAVLATLPLGGGPASPFLVLGGWLGPAALAGGILCLLALAAGRGRTADPRAQKR